MPNLVNDECVITVTCSAPIIGLVWCIRSILVQMKYIYVYSSRRQNRPTARIKQQTDRQTDKQTVQLIPQIWFICDQMIIRMCFAVFGVFGRSFRLSVSAGSAEALGIGEVGK